jgi:hypothetical protein
MTELQASSWLDLETSADAERKSTRDRRPWIAPDFKHLDLTTARAAGCHNANDGGSC